jgi:hypothetical protein
MQLRATFPRERGRPGTAAGSLTSPSRLFPLVATVHARQHPVTDGIKQQRDIELPEVRPRHADELLTHLTSRFSLIGYATLSI